jgi:hypothetical protein
LAAGLVKSADLNSLLFIINKKFEAQILQAMIGQLPQVFKGVPQAARFLWWRISVVALSTNDVLVYHHISMHIRLPHIPPQAAFALLNA